MTKQEILDYLEQCEVPMLDNGYYYHADQQLKIYRSGKDWIMILQVIQYHNHCFSTDGITTIVYQYGNLLDIEDTFTDDSFHFPIPEQASEVFLDDAEDYSSFLNPEISSIHLGSVQIPLEHNSDRYAERGITLESKNKIRPWEVLRYITPEYSKYLWISQEQLNVESRFKEEITLSRWEHPDGFETSLSDMKCFQYIAECLAENKPFQKELIETKESNTHWSNWPMGGTF